MLSVVSRLEAHRAVVDDALMKLGLGWEAWPGIVTDPRLDADVRLFAVLVLLAVVEGDSKPGPVLVGIDPEDEGLDWLGRERRPWDRLSRLRLPWTAATAATALESVTHRGVYDDRRFAIALQGTGKVCAAGQADAVLMEALDECVSYLESVGDEQWRIKELRNLARRVATSATPPEILDLSLLVDGDAWAGPAREAAHAFPADEVTTLVRLLGELGPRKPTQRWFHQVDGALEPASARQLLRRWIDLAAGADIVPEWPGSRIGDCLGTLFVGTNTDLVRAAVWATSRVRSEVWPAEPLGVLARRGAAHNGAPGLPEALSLKVASAAIDALATRGGAADHLVLADLLDDLQRRDLVKTVAAALDA
jgi:hypothetical protein